MVDKRFMFTNRLLKWKIQLNLIITESLYTWEQLDGLIQYAMHINRICISAKVYIAVNPQGFTWVVILIYSPQIDGNFKVIYDLPESSLWIKLNFAIFYEQINGRLLAWFEINFVFVSEADYTLDESFWIDESPAGKHFHLIKINTHLYLSLKIYQD